MGCLNKRADVQREEVPFSKTERSFFFDAYFDKKISFKIKTHKNENSFQKYLQIIFTNSIM